MKMETTTKETQVQDLVPVDIVDTAMAVEAIGRQVQLIRECMRQNMQKHIHFGKIPGCPKPSLWQPGADLLNLMFRLRPEFEVISAARNDSVIAYTVRCDLTHIPSRQLVGTGLGSCNTREQKYQKTITKRQVHSMELDNTILKMAAKRAKIAATMNATAASEVFTHDLGEDPPAEGEPDANPEQVQPAQDSGTGPQVTGGAGETPF